MRQIENDKLLSNINEMINVLEYDSSRSPGKTKVNAQTLINLYTLKEKYEKNSKKPTPKTEVSNNG
jgi:hypothetical protein